MINRQQTAQRALTGDGVVKNTQSYLRCKICASVRHLPKMDKSVVQYLPHFLLLEHLASQTESTAKAAQTTRGCRGRETPTRAYSFIINRIQREIML